MDYELTHSVGASIARPSLLPTSRLVDVGRQAGRQKNLEFIREARLLLLMLPIFEVKEFIK